MAARPLRSGKTLPPLSGRYSRHRPLTIVGLSRRIDALHDALAHERQLRRDAESNVRKFHALLLAERIKHLPPREKS